MKLPACLVVVVLLLGGCTGSGPKAGSETLGSGVPSWVLNPDKAGFVSVVGSAPKQDWGGHAAQYRVAEMKARQELAQMVRVQVESSSKFSVEENSGEVTHSSEIETKLRSNTEINLEEARVVEEWTDPQTGELYLWLVIPK